MEIRLLYGNMVTIETYTLFTPVTLVKLNFILQNTPRLRNIPTYMLEAEMPLLANMKKPELTDLNKT